MSESAAKHVTLRPIEAADWPAVHEWASLPETCRFQPWGPNTEDETRAFVAAAAATGDARPQTRYSYLALTDGRVIGAGEVKVRNAEHRHGEISYILHPSVWRQGYGTALARALLGVGFDELGFHRMMATCDPRNLGSAGVLTNAGLVYEGRMREALLLDSGWRDSSFYSILESEWTAR
ncbi:GNAT family N-acetyltransferase [Actinospica robiniae]|uniref:GNAT family N-acetyltransferase n=1 Tax=Actinospica robiniae TaxID=304901 RepID=UPI0004009B5F|nr:GNAT family protein [Actinospica robiniae]